MASSLRVNSIIPSSGTNVAIGTAGGTVTYTATVSGVSTFSSGLYVTGGSVGIGTDNPAEKLNVEGKSIFTARSFSNNLVISPNNHSAGTDIECFNNGNSVKKSISLNPYGGNVGVGVTNPSNIFQVTPSGLGAALSVDSSGRVITQYRPAFFAYPNTGSSLGGVQTYVFSLTQFNIGSHYSTATGRFTAPIAGVYRFDYGVQHNASVSDNLAVDLNVNNSQYSSVVRTEIFTSSTFHIVTASATIYLNASDFVTIASISGTAWGDNCWFSGYHVG